jgi:glycosyltransferase involved in cell wall biosynthesis
MIDVIIVSCGKSVKLRTLTQNSVNSCYNSTGDFNIIVIETCQNVQYQNCKTLYFKPSGRFNYNRALNYGASQCSGKYIACCNNDLIFSKTWAVNMLNVFDNYDLDSLSPFEPDWHKTWHECKNMDQGNYLYRGCVVRVQFTGWCYVIKREAYNKINRFSESVEFYYSDNIVAEQYKKHGVKHALCGNSIVKHLGEKTWRSVLCSSNQRYYTSGQLTLYNRAKKALWST